MFQEEIDQEYIVTQNGTSEGTQVKYYKEGYWYKKDSRGREGLAEYLVSQLLTFSDLEKEEYVLYEQGTINGRWGCRSKNFLKREEELITFYRLYQNQFGRDLSQVIGRMDTMEERIEFVIQFVYECCRLDVRNYLAKIFQLDKITLNEDRHLNNLALIYDGGKFIPAPIFDNGVSLLTANQSVNRKLPVSENIRRVTARPFSGSHQKMSSYFGNGFSLDIKSALEWLEQETDSFEKDVLLYQLISADCDK